MKKERILKKRSKIMANNKKHWDIKLVNSDKYEETI